MAELLTALQNVFTLLFVVTSMLAMGLSLTIPQILGPLKNARLVVMALVANFVVVPAAAVLLSRLIPMEQPFQIGLLLIATAVNVPLALSALYSRTTVNRLGQEESSQPAKEGWVWQPPAVTGEWPAPDRWAVHRGLMLRYYTVRAEQGGERYAMEV